MNSTAPQRPQRYTDLVHQLDGRKRSPVVPGSWVVVAPEDLAGGVSLAKVVDGPNYQHADGVAIQAVWKLHDGREVPQLRLTAVDLTELLESATDALRWLRNGVHPDRILPEMLRAHRAAAMARRTMEVQTTDDAWRQGQSPPVTPGIFKLDGEDLAPLRSLVAVSAAITGLEDAWREMMRSRLPNLVRSLYWAGALEVSRRAGAAQRDERQAKIFAWTQEAFSVEQTVSLPQRGLRLIEEAIEAFQAVGGDPAQAHRLIDYVFGRPVSELGQELGGVGVCVLALAAAAGLSADAEEQREVERVLAKPIEEFRRRNAAKNAAGFLARSKEQP